jgi:hypothetical protein
LPHSQPVCPSKACLEIAVLGADANPLRRSVTHAGSYGSLSAGVRQAAGEDKLGLDGPQTGGLPDRYPR